MNVRVTTIAVAMLGIAACGTRAGGPPPIVVDRSACSHCGMLISELRYAAAYQPAGKEARVFDDIGCLRAAAASEAGPLTFWFHDGGDGTWIDGTPAAFVESSEIRTPMSGGVIAFRDAAAARRAASTYRGRIVGSVSDLLVKEGKS